ncbi:MAG: Asp-tRNA(Asn)/Glu-tRNA(Gln) amidotransferase subunit GatC [Campylobacterales bacterium]
MHIDEQLLTKLEKLSMLKIDESKRQEVMEQLSSIVDFVEVLGELDAKIEGIDVKDHSRQLPFREDVVCDSNVIEYVLASAPRAEEGFFIVPRIVE